MAIVPIRNSALNIVLVINTFLRGQVELALGVLLDNPAIRIGKALAIANAFRAGPKAKFCAATFTTFIRSNTNITFARDGL